MRRVSKQFDVCKRFYAYKPVQRPNLANQINKSDSLPKRGSEIVQSDLVKQLRARILTTGPITVADYMREVLTNPAQGYYMHKDVFGEHGDFITSPEISQIFGELLGVWLLTEWQKLGSPSPFQIVELGPGRGTLSRDVLRVLSQFKMGAKFSLHLVEISPFLSQMQAQRICYKHQAETDSSCTYHYKGETAAGTQVFWHRHLDDVPKGFSLLIAHEFFDALPVHKLQLVDGVWKEVLIDVSNETDFRFVLSKAPTPISSVFQALPDEQRQSLEYCVDGDILVRNICNRIEYDGGIALIIDYGHLGEKTDTFRAFKAHQLHDPLNSPGSADLTADVDFKRIKYIVDAHQGVIGFGPVEQGKFLQRMQGAARLEHLLKNALPENQEQLRTGYSTLTEPAKMGERFKLFSIFPATVKQHLNKFPVNGFHDE